MQDDHDDELPREVIHAIQNIFNVTNGEEHNADALYPTFNPVDVINQLFPNGMGFSRTLRITVDIREILQKHLYHILRRSTLDFQKLTMNFRRKLICWR
jgi:hypothetical protein